MKPPSSRCNFVASLQAAETTSQHSEISGDLPLPGNDAAGEADIRRSASNAISEHEEEEEEEDEEEVDDAADDHSDGVVSHLPSGDEKPVSASVSRPCSESALDRH